MTRKEAMTERLAAIAILNRLEHLPAEDRDLILDGIELWLRRIDADRPGPPGKQHPSGRRLQAVRDGLEGATLTLRMAA